MASDVALKLLAFFGFLAIVGGSTFAAYQIIQPEGFAPRGLVVEPLVGEIVVAPGHAANLGVLVRNGGAAAESVRLALVEKGPVPAASLNASLSIPAGEKRAGVLAIAIPAGAASGDHRVAVEATTVAEPVKRATAFVTVRVLGDGPSLGENQRASVHYVGRLGDGSLFNTNHPAYVEAPLPRAEFYRASPGNLTVQTGDAANVIPGFWKGVLGMQKGETRTITIAPADGYGEKILRETVNRTTTIERRFEIDVRALERPLASFEEHVRTTGQGNATDYSAGDTFTLAQGTNLWTFKITALTADTVTYVPAPPVGTKFTLPSTPAWENASVVQSVDDEKIVFYTTPSTKVGEAFTFHEHWPDASAIQRMNDGEIVVRHSPRVGLQYTPAGQPGGAAYLVEAVDEDAIKVTHESPNPLAGQTLVFDVTVLELLGDA